ncbi:MAG: hypothetical protein BGP04_13150 [Rhizobiales bacterium 62-17]|nr:hypothetical protein [Hyphomicrobiales bacterium]OJY02251.1 MAG: hypothetical protein BGP04_13150 [Rhizobiales bacterium 62-17]
MQPFDPTMVEKLPWLMQAVVYLAIFIATSLAMFWGYHKQPTGKEKKHEGSEFSEVALMREAVEALTCIAQRSESFVKLIDLRAQSEVRIVEAVEGILAHLREEASYEHGWRAGGRRRG